MVWEVMETHWEAEEVVEKAEVMALRCDAEGAVSTPSSAPTRTSLIS